MDPSLEIRKLSLASISELSRILEPGESWKKLMGLIPTQLSKDSYKCDLGIHNLPKYRSEHFRLIEDSAVRYKRLCTEILLDEWGTSGRIRPALGHLKYLLEKAELFRAADYVAVDLLKLEKPARPQKGPSAVVELNLNEIKNQTDKIEKMLDEMKYPSSIIGEMSNNESSIDTNINYSTKQRKALKTIPKIVISESPDVEEKMPSFNLPQVVQAMNETPENSVSDMIQFSTSSINQEEENDVNRPNISFLLKSESENNIESSEEENLPRTIFDNFTTNESSDLSSSIISESSNLPNLEIFKHDSSESEDVMLPDPIQLLNNGSALPKDNLPSDSNTLLTIQKSSKSSNSLSRSCTSPLPILSLNTLLPHYTYNELELATNNFDETPANQNGRFLGSGAFGKVYLAVGLLDKPIAVKKLLLDNTEVVHINDTVTKQFRNEVEVLSKYKHENLLSLLGYSCDGCTYCLMYEYIPGGALKDRLQQENKLIWTERLYIALGTAKAISYLHTAFSMPLIHRDVKTANILLDSKNKPKLCDFGLVKLTPNQNTNTNTTIFGTSAYMSPEAFRGDISVKLDTFSFGVVLLELLTSLPPYDEQRPGNDLVTHFQEVCEDDIGPLLDTAAGSWKNGDVNYAEELFRIANLCLEEKKLRPNMVEVTKLLSDLVQKPL